MQFSTSSKNLRVRSSSHNNTKSPTLPISPQKKFDHKKQIQATLNELHQLQAQIYNLNVPQNPHSSGPIKKEIKQLSYLYESMTKEPKVKNRLNVEMKDIKSALKVMNEGMQAIDEKVNPHRANMLKSESPSKSQQISLLRQNHPIIPQQIEPQSSLKIPSKTLKHLMKQLYDTDFDLSLISQTKSSRVPEITAQEISLFINYNEFDNFDPLKQAYNCLLDDHGKFSFKRYNEINEMFGLPKVKELGILKQAIGVGEGEEMTFERFCEIMDEGGEIYEA